MKKLSLTQPPPPKVDDDGLPDLDDEEPSTSSVVREYKHQRTNSQIPSTPEPTPPAPPRIQPSRPLLQPPTPPTAQFPGLPVFPVKVEDFDIDEVEVNVCFPFIVSFYPSHVKFCTFIYMQYIYIHYTQLFIIIRVLAQSLNITSIYM